MKDGQVYHTLKNYKKGDNFMEFSAVIFIAIVIETITELFKNWFPKLKEKEWVLRIATIVLGIIVCVAYGADLLADVGISGNIPYLGCILTGILVAGGSNIIYDIINKIRKSKNLHGKEDATSEDPLE